MRRVVKGGDDGLDEDKHINQPYFLWRVGQQKAQHNKAAQHVADDENQFAVEPVGQYPGQGAKQKGGEGAGEKEGSNGRS